MSFSRVEFLDNGKICVDVPGDVFKKMNKIIVWDEDNHQERHFYDPADINSDDMEEFDTPEIPKNYDDRIVKWVSIDTNPTTKTSTSSYDCMKAVFIVVFNERTFEYYRAKYYYDGETWEIDGICFSKEEMKKRGFVCWLSLPWPLKQEQQ